VTRPIYQSPKLAVALVAITISSNSRDPTKVQTENPPPNGPIHTVCHKLRNVMASAAEAEVGGLFVNGQDAVPLRTTLKELNHLQPPTPIKTDNSTASEIANNTLKERKSRAMDMRFYWICDRVKQNQFIIYWRPGTENLGDYFTKHHPASHHRLIRDSFLVPKPTSSKSAPSHSPSVLRGCVNSRTASHASARSTTADAR
jgi:hypothetical protein